MKTATTRHACTLERRALKGWKAECLTMQAVLAEAHLFHRRSQLQQARAFIDANAWFMYQTCCSLSPDMSLTSGDTSSRLPLAG